MISEARPDGIADPAKMQFTLIGRDADYIKSAWNLVSQLVLLQIDRGRPEQLLLFAVIDAGQWTHKITSGSETNLYEDQDSLIAHDQINFTEPTMIVALNE
jgi:hypothetical protein